MVSLGPVIINNSCRM